MTKVLFLSDFHLGIPDFESSKERETKICQLIDGIESQLSEIYFVGDVFDFWFEYDTVVPKGYYRLFGKLNSLSEKGIKLHFFKGNHDMWMRNLFSTEFNAKIYNEPIIKQIGTKKFYIGHGDGLGPGDYKYKFLKRFFASPLCQFLYKWIHPDFGMRLASFFSYKSRYSQLDIEDGYLGNEKEWLYIYSKSYLEKEAHIDYFIYGHRHLPIYTNIENTTSKYINLGDWIHYNTYAIFDGNEIHLYQYDSAKNNRDFDPNIHLNQ